MRNTLLIVFLLMCTLTSRAQKWNWAVSTEKTAEYIDIAIDSQGRAVSIYRGHEHNYMVCVHDTAGNLLYDHGYYFRHDIGNSLYAVDTDVNGNIYVVSRQSVTEYVPPKKRNRGAVDEEEPDEDDEGGDEKAPYIVLEIFDSALNLTATHRLIKIDEEQHAVSVSDMVVDADGNVWICGRELGGDYEFKGVHVKGGDGGGMYLLKLQHHALNLGWISTMTMSGTCCSWMEGTPKIAVNKDGICVMTAAFDGDLTFSNESTFYRKAGTKFEYEMFMAGFDADGNIKWTQRLGAPSSANGIVALANGSFVCSAYFTEATTVCGRIPDGGKTSGFLLVKVDADNGRFGTVYFNDTSAIENLLPGPKNGFYCTLQLGNSSSIWHVYYFNADLSPRRLTRFHGDEPVTAIRNGVFVCAGDYGWNCSFGDRKPNWLYIGGSSSDYGSFMATCYIERKVE